MPCSGAEVLPTRCPGDPTVVYHPSSLGDTRFATVTVATEDFWGNKEGRPLLSSKARVPAQPLHAPSHTESPQLRKAWSGCCDPTNLPNFRKPLSIDGFTVYMPLLLKLDLRQDPLKLRLHSWSQHCSFQGDCPSNMGRRKGRKEVGVVPLAPYVIIKLRAVIAIAKIVSPSPW